MDVAVRRDPAVVLPTGVLDVVAPLEVRIEDWFAGCAPARLGTWENQLFSTNPSDEMLY